METYAEISKKNRVQLLKDLDTSRKALFDIKYQVVNKQTKSSHGIKNIKKTIAQIMTALKNAPMGSKEELETEEKTVQNVAATEKPKKATQKRATKPSTTKAKSTK